MAQFSIFDWLPMSPFEGPPLPRCFGLYWPFAAATVNNTQQSNYSPPNSNMISNVTENISPDGNIDHAEVITHDRVHAGRVVMANEQTFDIIRGENNRISQIVVHRKVVEYDG